MEPFILPLIFFLWLLTAAISVPFYPRTVRKARARAEQPGAKPEDTAKMLRQLRRRLLVTLVLGVVGAIGLTQMGIELGWASGASAKSQGWSDGSSAALHAIASQYVGPLVRSDSVGATVVIIAGDQRGVSGFDRIRLSQSQLPDGNTIFEIGSITKAFTGILLAEAIERGELEIDRPVAGLVSEASAIPAIQQGQSITLKHLTTHTSGLPRLPPGFFSVGRLWRPLFGRDPYRNYSMDDWAKALRTVELEAAPGTQHSYSNFGAGLLGEALSRRANTDYADLVHTRICEPLDMGDTVVTLNQDQSARLATGYRARLSLWPLLLGLRAENWEAPRAFAGAGALRSSAKDMQKFLAANMGLRTSELAPALKLAQQEQFRVNDQHAAGMGWQRTWRDDVGQVVIWHNGGTGGYHSFLGFTEDRRVGVVILTNSSTNCDPAGFEVLAALTK
ncbi:MAG: beta-lactamase family protein [Candidatus Hydrogenedentes bacterium]|nr:beta-lactamase family protein [Candidatus Hydrogenedentota bacterium]